MNIKNKSTLSEGQLGLSLIMFSAVLWGTVGIATKTLYGLSATNSLSIGFFRLAISVPPLLWMCGSTLGWQMFRVRRSDWIWMILIGCMTATYQVCYFAAIARIGVAAATLTTLCTAPVFVALLASVWLQERLTPRVILSGCFAVAGTALLVGLEPDAIGLQSGRLIGILLSLGSAFSYAMMTLCSRALSGRYHPLQPLTIGFSISAIALLPFAIMSGFVVEYPSIGWGLLVYLGLIPTALAYLLYFNGIRHTTATAASIATLLEPLTSTILAWWIFGEQLGSLGLVGAILLLSAIALLCFDRPRRKSA